MPGLIAKENLQILKTEKALSMAMSTLLERHSFKKITVSDLCKEALISRAAFYAHYTDKYDFLKYWLKKFVLKHVSHEKELGDCISELIHKNKKIIKNLALDANIETLDILLDFILSIANLNTEKSIEHKANLEHVVLSNFFAGGMLHCVLWQIRNISATDTTEIGKYLGDIIEKFQIWSREEG